MYREAEVDPITGKIGTLSRLTGLSPSTIRRRLKDDPSFPKPFRLTPDGDLLWVLAEIRVYLERKAGRPVAHDTPALEARGPSALPRGRSRS